MIEVGVLIFGCVVVAWFAVGMVADHAPFRRPRLPRSLTIHRTTSGDR